MWNHHKKIEPNRERIKVNINVVDRTVIQSEGMGTRPVQIFFRCEGRWTTRSTFDPNQVGIFRKTAVRENRINVGNKIQNDRHEQSYTTKFSQGVKGIGKIESYQTAICALRFFRWKCSTGQHRSNNDAI